MAENEKRFEPRRSSYQRRRLLQPGPLGKYAIALSALALVGLIAAGYFLYLHNRAKTQAPPAAVSTAAPCRARGRLHRKS